jgi:hypothetical protein
MAADWGEPMPGSPLQFIILLLAAAFAQAASEWTLTQATADPLLPVAPPEKNRVHPSPSGEVTPFPPEPGTPRFVLFNNIKTAERPRLVYIRVADQFEGAHTSEPTRVWGLNVLVHNPDMTGPRNPQNAGELGVCAGRCPGEMLISIYKMISGVVDYEPSARRWN